MLCNLCFHQCRMGEGETGYCTVRRGSKESLRHDGRTRARVSYYYDPLPTNCVADWVCAGGTGAGYPRYAHANGPEVGFHNLAVFFEACNFNCLYCQNWRGFKQAHSFEGKWLSVQDLVCAADERSSCICFFGGDPTPQLPYALRVSERISERRPGNIFRVCWETNGSVHPAWLRRMVELSLESGGCIKVDLKAWTSETHRALCGFDNRHVLENFSKLATWMDHRPEPPLVLASTLLVPGYVNEDEVRGLAAFIARLNPYIPYSLLAFAPQFMMDDFPTTSRAQAEACLEAARGAGLRRVRVGNPHLLM
jgi:pyruvate formate lyase activating enzyme